MTKSVFQQQLVYRAQLQSVADALQDKINVVKSELAKLEDTRKEILVDCLLHSLPSRLNKAGKLRVHLEDVAHIREVASSLEGYFPLQQPEILTVKTELNEAIRTGIDKFVVKSESITQSDKELAAYIRASVDNIEESLTRAFTDQDVKNLKTDPSYYRNRSHTYSRYIFVERDVPNPLVALQINGFLEDGVFYIENAKNTPAIEEESEAYIA